MQSDLYMSIINSQHFYSSLGELWRSFMNLRCFMKHLGKFCQTILEIFCLSPMDLRCNNKLANLVKAILLLHKDKLYEPIIHVIDPLNTIKHAKHMFALFKKLRRSIMFQATSYFLGDHAFTARNVKLHKLWMTVMIPGSWLYALTDCYDTWIMTLCINWLLWYLDHDFMH